MAGKDNWRGFLDAIYSKWRLFLPILSPFSPLPPLIPPPLPCPPAPHLLARSYLSSLFSSASISYSNVKYGLTSSVRLRGTTSCELRILANAAIYLKWQIRRSNLLGMRRSFELSSFWKKLVFSPLHGEHLRLSRALMKRDSPENKMGFDLNLYLLEWGVGECFESLQALWKLHVVQEVQSWLHVPNITSICYSH